MVNRQQINEAVERGSAWLKSSQNANGSYGRWGPGSTGLAVMALLHSGVPNSDPAVAKAVSYILNSKPQDSTYFRSLAVMALIAGGEKTPPAAFSRVQLDTEWLIQAQGSDPGDILSYGGWGHSSRLEVADGSNTQFALLALYSASRWGLTVPDETWNSALTWYKRNHHVNNNGSCVYSLDDLPWFNSKGVLYAITAGALLSMKIINLCSADPDVKFQAQNLLESALGWLNTNYTIELKSCVRDSWHFYYLFSMQTACVLEPHFAFIGTHDWYADMADYLISVQQPDGKWLSEADKKSTNIVYSSFALINLSSKAIADPVKLACDGAEEKSDLGESYAITIGRYDADKQEDAGSGSQLQGTGCPGTLTIRKVNSGNIIGIRNSYHSNLGGERKKL